MTERAAMTNALMWFRADLRVHDNTALWHAMKTCRGGGGEAGGVIGVFTICPAQWKKHDWAGVKVDFLLRTLKVLSDDLAAVNMPLVVLECPTFRDVPPLLLATAKQHRCGSLFFNDEYEVNEAERDADVRELFEQNGLEVESFTDQVVLPPGSVRTGEGRYYTVFTPFKKAYYAELDRRRGGASGKGSPIEPLAKPRKLETVVDEKPSNVPAGVEGFESHVTKDVREKLYPAGEHAAMKRLKAFLARKAESYKDRRDFPAEDATSVLSPYLAIGAVSPRQCFHAAVEANGGRLDNPKNPGLSAWISELTWREFYKHILVGFPRVSKGRAFKPETDKLTWRSDEQDFAAWCEGRTGVPIVDAGMRQLMATGWMHNRLRMVAAMYLTKDLFIDWRWGERHFMQHLVDGDLSQNNGGWQWSASTGNDAAPYFRIFNPVSQSRKFDADGLFIRRYVPELASLDGGPGGKGEIHDPSEMPELARAQIEYPPPIVDHSAARDRTIKAFQAL